MRVGNARALFVQVCFFLALSLSLSYLSLCRSLSLLFVLVASVNSLSLPHWKNPAFAGSVTCDEDGVRVEFPSSLDMEK
ncbi:hypothetical protein LEMLEM_LOCUS2581, partial [Lemmus lemmus]